MSVIWACHWGGGLGCRETLIFLIYPPSLLLCAVSVLDMNMEIKSLPNHLIRLSIHIVYSFDIGQKYCLHYIYSRSGFSI